MTPTRHEDTQATYTATLVDEWVRGGVQAAVVCPGSRSKIEARPLPADDPRQRQPDISLARSTLNWAPKTQLDEGLKKTIAYFDATLAEISNER